MNFVNGDIVVYKQDSARTVWRVGTQLTEGDKHVLLYPLRDNIDATSGASGMYIEPKPEYPHLLMLAEPLMQFFRYGNLPDGMQQFSRPFWDLATHIVTRYPRNPERTVALRKLLEAKDAAVRSTIYQG